MNTNGIWISFVKNEKDVLKPSEALEEALCFGWIDGQMKKIDDSSYMKYFAPRTKNSSWSKKNIDIMEKLIKSGLVHNHGKNVYLKRKKDENKDKCGKQTTDMVGSFMEMIKKNKPLLEGYSSLSNSNQKRMAGFYFDAKQEETRKKRMEKIQKAIKEGYKGMLY